MERGVVHSPDLTIFGDLVNFSVVRNITYTYSLTKLRYTESRCVLEKVMELEQSGA